MIHLAADYIVDELNAYLNVRSPSLTPGRVVQSNLLAQDGKVEKDAKDKVVLSVVNVEEDRIFRSVRPTRRQEDGGFERVQPDVKLYVYLLFVANLGDYSEALKALSYIVSYFQVNNHVDYVDVPSVEGVEGRLIFELYSQTFEQQNHLWGALGAKYRPSIMYRMGLTTIRDTQKHSETPPIREIDISDSGQPER